MEISCLSHKLVWSATGAEVSDVERTIAHGSTPCSSMGIIRNAAIPGHNQEIHTGVSSASACQSLC